MRHIIPCKIECVKDDDYLCAIITLRKEFAIELLLLLDALKYDRIRKFACNDKKCSAIFSLALDGEMQIYISGLIQENLLCTQTDLLRCCCIDCVFENYDFPHVDYEFEKVDLTIGFC